MSGNQWSPNTDLNPAKNWDYVTGLVGFATRRRSATTRSRTSSSRGSRRAASGRRRRPTHDDPQGRQVERRADDDAAGREVQLRPRSRSRRIRSTRSGPDTGLKSTKVSGNERRLHVRRQPRHTSSSTSTASTSRSFRSTSSRATQDATSRPATSSDTKKIVGTGPYAYQSGVGAASETVVWKKRGDWWATKALGLKRRSDVRRRHQERHERRRAVEPARRATSTCSTTSRRSPRSRASSRRTSTVRRTTSARTRRGSSRTRRRSRSTTSSSAARWPTRSTWARSSTRPTRASSTRRARPGLLPIWDKWVDKKVVKQYGFSYNAGQGEGDPRGAGYKDTNGDGYVENKDGSNDRPQDRLPERVVRLDDAIQVIADSAKAVGIKITPAFPEYGDAGRRPRSRELRPAARQRPAVLATRRGRTTSTSSSCPILENQTTVNYERYTNQTAWNLTRRWTRPRRRNTGAYQAIDVQAADDLPAGSARDPALVQRHVVDGEHEVLDELAVQRRAASITPDFLAELLADDRASTCSRSLRPAEHVVTARAADDRATPLPAPSPGGVLLVRLPARARSEDRGESDTSRASS